MQHSDNEPSYPADLVPRLAAAIHSEGFPSGDRAKLKRLSPGKVAPVAYWRFITQHIPDKLRLEHIDGSWRTLIAGIAQQSGNPHNPSLPLGQALAEAGLSEARLEGLLAAEGRVLQVLVSRASRRLASSRRTCNWKQVADLLFARNPDFRERVNRKIASDFFRASAGGAGQMSSEIAKE